MKLVSIIIVNYNLTNSVEKLLNSIENNVKDIEYEVIIVDNNSPDRSIENLKEKFPHFQFLFLGTNFGFGHGNNSGVKISTGKYILLLNPDTYLIDNLSLQLYQFAEEHPDFGVIGPRLIFPDGSDQVSYAKFPNLKQELLYAVGLIGIGMRTLYKLKDFFYKIPYYNVDFVFGSCMFIRKDLFEMLNGFDEDYFLFTEETDLCYRIKNNNNSKIIYWKHAKVVHEKSLITGENIPRRIKLSYVSKLIFFNKRYSKFRVVILRRTIIFIFVFKHLTLFRKRDKKQQFRTAYRQIIKHYKNSNN